MAMASTEMNEKRVVSELEFKSSPDVSMDRSLEDHSLGLDSFDDGTPALTTEICTQVSTANLNDDNNSGGSDNDLEEPVKIDENSIPSVIEEISPVDGLCVQCEIEQPCSFWFTVNGETLYICNEPCIKAYQAEYPGKYTVTRKKYIIQEITPKTLLCSECEEKKTCYFCHNFDGEDTYYCSLNCLEGMMADEKDKYAFKLNSVTICIDQIRPREGQCLICEEVKPCEFSLVRYGEPCFLCERTCIKILSGRECGRYYIKKLKVSKPAVSNAVDKHMDEGYKIQEKTAAMVQREQSFHRRCSQCMLILMIDENVLTWEAMDFCDAMCLERFQNGIGSRCVKCNALVPHTSLGKYCVRFGYDIRHFCNSSCLEEFKKGLKLCCYCQRDISAVVQVILTPVGEKGQFKDFCTQSCVEKFDQMSKNPVPEPVWAKCAVCSLEKATTIELEVTETASQRICSDPCFAAYKFVKNIIPDQCKWCKKYFERTLTRSFTTYDDPQPNSFCSLSCMTIHINKTRVIVSCDRCKSIKYNIDMIRRVDNDHVVMMCSLNCLNQESSNTLSSSNDVSPPTLAPPLPSIEQGRADVTALAVEQLITLTKSRKRRGTSSKQAEPQRNESEENIRLIPDSSRSAPKKKARSSSGVSPPTLAPPLPSIEQSRADVTALAVEQLITLTKSRKRRGTSSKQEEPQRNESEKNTTLIPDSSCSARKKKARSSSMSSGRAGLDPPSEFLDVVYGEEGSKDEGSGDEYLEISNLESDHEDYEGEPLDRSPEAPPYSPLSPPERRERLSPMDYPTTPPPAAHRNRERSGSPLQPSNSLESATEPLEVVLRIYDEDGVPLDIDDGEFYAPDTHSLYELPGERERDERNRDACNRRRTRGRRGGRRGVRGVRGQSVRRGGYPYQGRREGRQWVMGHPLNEIWTSDEDVPTELVRLSMDVLRRRQIRIHDDAMVDRIAERGGNASESEDDDEFLDASAGDDALPRSESQNLHFEWSSMETFQGEEHNFIPERTGSVRVFNSAYDAFRSYWSDDVLGLIVAETNQYATKIVATSVAFQSGWFPTNIDEILCLFAFWMMLGIVKMPTITSCFSVDPLLKTEIYRRIFTRRRYEMLTRAINFVDSDAAINNPNPSNTSAGSFDRLHRLRPIITHLNSAFQSNYILSKDICIDESLTLWKGRLSFKQYIRSKASKFGIKTFELCESTTGYLWSFIVYTGKQSATDLEQSPGVLKSTAVVKKLIGPLLNKGYRLFMDNWYNSPLLARFLKRNGTDCVGTLRSSRRDVPILINKAPLKRGEYIARHSGDVTVLSWQDKKRITMISTCHGASTALPTVSSKPSTRPVPFKPQVVLDYNKFMGGVDLKDQMLEPYLLERKRCGKWYMKLFKRLLNVSILNSRILLQSSTQKNFDHLAFRLQLVDSILTNHLSHSPQSRRNTVSSSRSSHSQPGRYIISTHWPILLEPTESSSARNRNFWKRCFVCLQQGKKSQRTPYCCESCRVPLCIKDCFKSYHTFK